MEPPLEPLESSGTVRPSSPRLVPAPCPICQTEGAPRLFSARDRIHRIPGDFSVHGCKRCCAIFIEPMPSVEELSAYYPESYGRYRVSKSLDKKSYGGWGRFVLAHYYGYPTRDGAGSSSLQRAAAYVGSWFTAKGVIPYRGNGKILDVGAGSGAYLQRLKQWGWETYGVEPSVFGARQAQSLGLAVHHGTLGDARFPSSFFDVVRLSNVLEHLPDPKAVFEEIDRILKPDGLVYVTVPNTRSLVFWLFRENWYALDAPRHVISYCPLTLKTLCEQAGLEIASIRFTAGPFNFVRSLTYYFEENGRRWPACLSRVRWERSKTLRRVLKPFFAVVDGLGYGDFLHAVLRKKPSQVFVGARIFQKPPVHDRAVDPGVP